MNPSSLHAGLRVRDEGAVRILTLERPPSNNLSMALLAELREAVAAAGTAPDVRCLALASALPKYFSAGLDLEEMTSLPPERREDMFRLLLQTHRELAALPKPTVASIGGYALLGGWILAMACDFRLIARETGRVALSEVRLGLSPSTALVARLRHIGATAQGLREMVLKGRALNALEALAAGVADRAVPLEELGQATSAEARALAKLPPAAYASIKRSLAEADGHASEALWSSSMTEFHALFAGAEAREGLAAMREKRRPRWRRHVR